MITLEIPSQNLTGKSAPKESSRRQLDRVFLHDLLNTAGGVQGLAQIMLEADFAQMCELRESVKNLADQIVEEITGYQIYLDAEHGGLAVAPEAVLCRDCLARTRTRFMNHPVTGDRQIIIAPGLGSISVVTDPVILGRVLANMTKNALEAAPEGAVVTLDCGLMPGKVWISVHNPGFIPRKQQGLVFRRDFSTKGKGRGLGTYGMRVLAERYLGGRVDFTSDPLLGTTFTVILPDVGP